MQNGLVLDKILNEVRFVEKNLNLAEYFDEYSKNLLPESLFEKLKLLKDVLLNAKQNNGKIIFAGNGASAAISSHAALDLTKQGKIRSMTFNEAALITALVNDYGNDIWLVKACEFYVDENDVVIFISVSGESPNIVNAAQYLNSKNITSISFTGKNKNNSLNQITELSFWVDSNSYNIVESIHMMWITTVIDMIIGKKDYSVS